MKFNNLSDLNMNNFLVAFPFEESIFTTSPLISQFLFYTYHTNFMILMVVTKYKTYHILSVSFHTTWASLQAELQIAGSAD